MINEDREQKVYYRELQEKKKERELISFHGNHMEWMDGWNKRRIK